MDDTGSRSRLAALEQGIFDWLMRSADVLPPRWQRWLAMHYPDARIRRAFWQKTLVEMGDGTYANPGMIVVDDFTSGECLLSIGKHVSIAPGVIFAPQSAPNNSPTLQRDPYVQASLVKREKIVIEDHVWLGAHATVLAGVRVGRGSIVGAGAVVVRDVPPHTVVAGVPARPVRQLDPFD